jgi:uracil-DNA glycosylase family 4
MKGFLDIESLSVVRGDEIKITRKTKKQLGCTDCGLNKSNNLPSIFGKGGKRIMFVFDTPTKEEARIGRPFADSVGRDLKEYIQNNTPIKNVMRDCYITYAIKCHSKKVLGVQCESCRVNLHKIIKEYNPAVIVAFGYWAVIGLVGDILNSNSRGKVINDWTGYVIPDRRFRKWIIPVFDLYYFEGRADNVKLGLLKEYLTKAVEYINIPVKPFDYKKNVHLLETAADKLHLINTLLDMKRQAVKEGRRGIKLALDYETTGLKPHRKGHSIISIAISTGKETWAFDYDESDNAFNIGFKSLLISPNVFWIVHNLQFEWLWTYSFFGVYPLNIEHDTILGLHVYNSQKLKGLKPNVYRLFGVAGYDDDVEGFISCTALESKRYGANGINNMRKVPVDKRLLYNALDSYFTFKIARFLDNNLSNECKGGYRFLMDSAVTLAMMTENGVRIDTLGVQKVKDELTIELAKIEKRINKLAIGGGWRGGVFRPSASSDISKYLFDIKGYKNEAKTESGRESTDKKALEKINDPIVPLILDWKKLQKLRDTYINGLGIEVVGDKLRPFFNLYTVVTYRSSSTYPNLQNVPKRDKKSFQIIRSLLYPHKGHKLIELDYKSLEVCISACYNKDRNLINYINNPESDMHFDTGVELFMYEDNKEAFQKCDRSVAKNQFVFPEFYGSYFMQTAPGLWNDCSKEAKDNLRKHGVRHLGDFTEHVKEIERSFWEDRFPEYTQWKKDTYNFYLKHGYIDSYTGFRYYAPMTKNEVLNIAIQGSAHHVLLRLMNRVNETIQKKRLDTKLIGEIHDSLLASVNPHEESYYDKIAWYYGTQGIRDDFKWLIVPLDLEKSVGGVDEPWSKLQEIGLLKHNGKTK